MCGVRSRDSVVPAGFSTICIAWVGIYVEAAVQGSTQRMRDLQHFEGQEGLVLRDQCDYAKHLHVIALSNLQCAYL